MAFGMKQWVVVVALFCALITAWRLPLDFVARSPSSSRLAEEVSYASLERELRDARATLDQIRRVGRLPAVALSSATDRVSVVVPDHRERSPGNSASLEAMVRAEVRGLGARDPETAIGYAYDGGDGGVTGLAVSQGYRVETYVGEQEGTPYCLQVVVTRPSMVGTLVEADLNGTGWSRRTGSLLGPCAFYARYGLAGPAIQEWLEAGGLDLALGQRTAGSLEYPVPRRRSFMAIRLVTDLGGGMESERCLSRDIEICLAIFLDPERVDLVGAVQRRAARLSPVANAGSVSSSALGSEGRFLLSDLEHEFGHAAFHRFWTSDADVRPAFEAAFGVDLGEWLSKWLDERWGDETATPAPTLSAAFGSLLFVSLMTGLTAYIQRRRRVA